MGKLWRNNGEPKFLFHVVDRIGEHITQILAVLYLVNG
jgi:hypothetical protein